MKRTIKYAALLVVAVIFLAVGCFRPRSAETSLQTNINVALPRDTRNAEADQSLMKETAVIVSVPADGDFYVGKEKFPLDHLESQIGKSVKASTGAEKMIYLAAGAGVSQGAVVRVLDKVRKQGIHDVALVVDQPGESGSALSVLKVQIPSEPDPNQDLSTLKPNPLILVVSIAPDLKVKLNQEETGTVNDTLPLQQFLDRIFRLRKEQHVYNPQRAGSSELTVDERVEKTIVIKADKSVRYGDLIRIVDAVQSTRANPIILQIDETMIFTNPIIRRD